MKDFSSRIPSPGSSYKRRSPGKSPVISPSARSPGRSPSDSMAMVTPRKLNNQHPVLDSTNLSNNFNEQRERESTSTASSTQERQPQHVESSRPSGIPSPTASPSRRQLQQQLTASDALSMRRDGTEATVAKLRAALDEAVSRDTAAKAALAKSDAVILELRSTIRQLKRQIETLQHERQEESRSKDNLQQQLQAAHQEADRLRSSSQRLQEAQSQIESLKQQLQAQTNQNSKDSKIGELQVQLDRAHAQMLTADMVRKELEDTLEAEQYTWELRVQDQERTIAQLQQECETLTDDLSTCRSQWKEAETGWNEQVEDLKQQLTQARNRIAATAAQQAAISNDTISPTSQELLDKVATLERERAELQTCLDEALQELEAVDAELQSDDKKKSSDQDAKLVEPLQHLLRWVTQERSLEPPSLHSMSTNPNELVKQIQSSLESYLGDQSITDKRSKQQIEGLQTQLTSYMGELKNREESSSELRESLKEAVALLKPLQDAVAKAEVDKKKLQERITGLEKQRREEASSSNQKLLQRDHEIRSLQDQIVSLKEQVQEHKQLATARQNLLNASTNENSPRHVASPAEVDSLTKIQKAREELRRKRESEGNLKLLLRDAQTRFQSLHQQNEDVAKRNRELQGRLKDAEQQLVSTSTSVNSRGVPSTDLSDQNQDELEMRDRKIAELTEELERARAAAPSLVNNFKNMETELSQLREMQRRVTELDKELARARNDLAEKERAEQVLNKSLKEALGLLRPLQMHLEDAEQEKMEISKELRNLRKRFRQLQMTDHHDDHSRSTMGVQDVSIELVKVKEELEETVRQLELENSQLHDALEDMSCSEGSKKDDAKLRQKIVELNSRFEDVQNRLEDANVENYALVKALKEKDLEEKRRNEEFEALRKKCEKTEAELYNAKAIARSALVKVEELTMANVEQLSMTGQPVDIATSS